MVNRKSFQENYLDYLASETKKDICLNFKRLLIEFIQHIFVLYKIRNGPTHIIHQNTMQASFKLLK